MKKLVITFLLVYITISAFSASITAIASGNWTNSNTAIWSPAQVPGSSDTIIIPSGIIVTIPNNQIIDLRGAGTAVIIIQDGGTLHLVQWWASIWMDSGDGSKIVLETANSSLILDFGTGIVQGSSLFISPGNYSGPATLQDGTLPIELLYFRAKQRVNVVSLEWATSLEENFDFFTVERSIDGMNFGSIAEIQGIGNSIEKQIYFFNDRNPLPGQLYYRLKATDFDGSYEYFDIVTVRFTGTGSNAVVLYPNPTVNGQVNIRLNYSPCEEATIQIYDQMGREYMVRSLSGSHETLDLPVGMESGVYIVHIVDQQNQTQSKLIVR
jgi:hypothetical protein